MQKYAQTQDRCFAQCEGLGSSIELCYMSSQWVEDMGVGLDEGVGADVVVVVGCLVVLVALDSFDVLVQQQPRTISTNFSLNVGQR